MAVATPHRDSESPPTWNALFDALSSSRRRHLLSFLNGEGEVTVSRLVDRIASAEEACPMGSLTSAQTTPVHTSLHHVHIPALEETGPVSRDRRERTGTLTEDSTDLPVFDSIESPPVSLRVAVTGVQTDV